MQVTRQHSKKDQWALDDMVTQTEAKQTVQTVDGFDGHMSVLETVATPTVGQGLDCGICRPRTCPRGRPEIQNSRRGDET